MTTDLILHQAMIATDWFLCRANRISNFLDGVNEDLISRRRPKLRISKSKQSVDRMILLKWKHL